VGRIKKQKMKGVLLFAFNTPDVDYVKMASVTAKKVNSFLDLPCTLITDCETNLKFDNVLYLERDASNHKRQKVWNNKGRYNAYDLSPYDETIILDVDYVLNSNKLTQVFDFYDDFCVHNSSGYLMYPNSEQEKLGQHSFNTLWATVLFFKKTERVKLLFDCVKMVQENYDHYVDLHGMWSDTFRNDHAFAIANRILNGHLEDKSSFIPWNLLHIGEKTYVEKLSETNYKVILKEDKSKYILIKDIDFHMLNKDNFIEMFDE
jgi:hypothetical protein